MSKPYQESDLSDILDEDLIWRRRELSDIKTALKSADTAARPAFLRSVITMGYAHWEGYVRTCANRYFEFLVLRKKTFAEFERQIYVNSILGRLDALSASKVGVEARCKLVSEILDGTTGTFSRLNPNLIDTRSNLSTDVIKDICRICAVDGTHFENKRTFIDTLLLKRRNAIAHGQLAFIGPDEIDDLIAEVLGLMGAFRSLLENKVYMRAYAA